jgi:hypothetical protein
MTTIAFIEQNVSSYSVLLSLACALSYTIGLPWLELAISRLAWPGKRRRNDEQYRESQRTISRRKVIANEEEELILLEIKNAKSQVRLNDIELVKQYQAVLSEENFLRWTNE